MPTCLGCDKPLIGCKYHKYSQYTPVPIALFTILLNVVCNFDALMCLYCLHQERSIEAAANDSLSSVRRKTADVQYHVKLLTALRELRDHRRESSKKKGDLYSA